MVNNKNSKIKIVFQFYKDLSNEHRFGRCANEEDNIKYTKHVKILTTDQGNSHAQ